MANANAYVGHSNASGRARVEGHKRKRDRNPIHPFDAYEPAAPYFDRPEFKSYMGVIEWLIHELPDQPSLKGENVTVPGEITVGGLHRILGDAAIPRWTQDALDMLVIGSVEDRGAGPVRYRKRTGFQPKATKQTRGQALQKLFPQKKTEDHDSVSTPSMSLGPDAQPNPIQETK